MITTIRSARVSQGVKAQTAVEWAIKVAHYLNEKYGTNSQVHLEVGGDLNRVHWFASYDSLAHAEELVGQFMNDPGYQALVNEAFDAQMFSGDSMTDRIYRSVP